MEFFYGVALGAVVTYALTHISSIKTEVAAIRAEVSKLTGGKL